MFLANTIVPHRDVLQGNKNLLISRVLLLLVSPDRVRNLRLRPHDRIHQIRIRRVDAGPLERPPQPLHPVPRGQPLGRDRREFLGDGPVHVRTDPLERRDGRLPVLLGQDGQILVAHIEAPLERFDGLCVDGCGSDGTGGIDYLAGAGQVGQDHRLGKCGGGPVDRLGDDLGNLDLERPAPVCGEGFRHDTPRQPCCRFDGFPLETGHLSAERVGQLSLSRTYAPRHRPSPAQASAARIP